MLLWPEPRLPPRDWIDARHDETLLAAALQRLSHYAYVDVVENPGMLTAFSTWLGRGFDYSPANVSAFMPPPLRFNLEAVLNAGTTALLAYRNRLDIRLWRAVAAERVETPPLALGSAAMAQALARYAALMGAD